MLTRIIVAVLLAPAFLAVLVAAPIPVVTVMVAGIAAMGSYELLRATGAASGRKSIYIVTAAAAALIPVCYWQGIESWGVPAVTLALACMLFLTAILAYGREGAVPAESILFCLFGGILIPVFLSALICLRTLEKGGYLVMLPVVAAFLTDIGAYFVGMFLGKHRGVTMVSPNKSLEGFAGGLASGVVFMLLYALLLQNVFHLEVKMLNMAVYGLLGSLVTMLGDLSYSLIKRQYGIKDYGRLLPGHGGMLDRFDSLSFAAPAMWVLVSIFPAL
ncbi:MAG: phosphatidate cytidylyltransferase [Oscillospiraceae bacterium]|nr:phosphatidate cytidylyltransferase [Oscillospiraceae bacterium]